MDDLRDQTNEWKNEIRPMPASKWLRVNALMWDNSLH